jgi:hypothetical protein
MRLSFHRRGGTRSADRWQITVETQGCGAQWDSQISVIELDAEPNAEYYVRVEIATGFVKGHGRVVLMPPSQGALEIRKLQPLGSDKVKDNS